MRIMRSLPVALAASLMIAAPSASAQPMTAAEARAQVRQWCADAAQRNDEPARAWHAAHCMNMDRDTGGSGGGAAVGILVGLAAAVIAIFH